MLGESSEEKNYSYSSYSSSVLHIHTQLLVAQTVQTATEGCDEDLACACGPRSPRCGGTTRGAEHGVAGGALRYARVRFGARRRCLPGAPPRRLRRGIDPVSPLLAARRLVAAAPSLERL